MKICVLQDQYRDSHSPLADYAYLFDPSPWLIEAGHEVQVFGVTKANAAQAVIAAQGQGFDIFFNLCDAHWDEDRPGMEVAYALEHFGCAYTGSTFAGWELTREVQKLVARSAGHLAPMDFVVKRGELLPEEFFSFPLIVKHPHSYSSIGLTPQSVVHSLPELQDQINRMAEIYGSALVEEYIPGPEYTVLVAENPDDAVSPHVYVPMEFVFPSGEHFKHFDLKWRAELPMRIVPPGPIRIQLEQMARDVFLGLRMCSYARMDVRQHEETGELYFLEVNVHPAVFNRHEEAACSDVILEHDPYGYSHFIDTLIRSAFKRKPQALTWKRSYRPGYGYCLEAIRNIAEGETVIVYEGVARSMYSRSYAEANFDPTHFYRYAWPLSDNVYTGIGNPNPAEWRPINHSCDPNLWREGLNYTARRFIQAGEELTLDYSTFCTDFTSPFSCTCGTSICRGTVTGQDYRTISWRYGDHVSDYVRYKRES